MIGTPITINIPGHDSRTGIIRGESRNKNCWIVVFDGCSEKYRCAIHKDFCSPI